MVILVDYNDWAFFKLNNTVHLFCPDIMMEVQKHNDGENFLVQVGPLHYLLSFSVLMSSSKSSISSTRAASFLTFSN